MHEIFGSNGTLSKVLDGFERRRVQEQLATEVQKTLRRGEVGFFEAGTGTGKSLAYLIPTAAHALEQNSRLVVSTHTISLQEQLVTKDLPLVQRLYPDLKFALVKGWSNYVCHLRLQARRFGEAELELFESGDEHALGTIADWADTTEDGTRSDLPFEPDNRLWAQICAESDSCVRTMCPFYQQCHFFRDRARMAEADILVVNHHLLFADVSLRKDLGWDTEHAVLPDYDTVILDEAHHVEDVATTYMGSSLSQVGVEQLFGRLYSRRHGRVRGIIPRLLGMDAYPIVMEAREAVTRFFKEAIAVVGPFRRHAGDVREAGEKKRLTPELVYRWQMQVGTAALDAGNRLLALDAAIARGIKQLGKPEEASLLNLKGQAEAARRRVAALGRSLAFFGDPNLDEFVFWVEPTQGRGTFRLVTAPIDVGPGFAEWVAHQCRALILLSATLALDGKFDYQRGRLGLGEDHQREYALTVREARYDSPFDFSRQAMLAVVNDLPPPVDPGYAEQLADAVFRLVTASKGRALVLFTSFVTLRDVKQRIEPLMQREGVHLLAQGDAPRTHVLKSFRETEEATVLLGTDSFWEGVDIPGEALSLVVVTRLPFDVPTDPLVVARSERVKQAGGSPFGHYALPRAVLKLKQGFGRLIRTATDRGVVVICDGRILSKSYGRTFLRALPPCPQEMGSATMIADKIADFLQ